MPASSLRALRHQIISLAQFRRPFFRRMDVRSCMALKGMEEMFRDIHVPLRERSSESEKDELPQAAAVGRHCGLPSILMR